MGSYWSRVSPIDWCPSEKGNLETTGTQGEQDVKMKAQIGEMHFQAKEHQRLPANQQKPGERHGTDSFFLTALRRN